MILLIWFSSKVPNFFASVCEARLRLCVEFDRLPKKLLLVLAMFELVFHSESLKMPTTLLLGLVILRFSQKFEPYTFLR